MNKSERIQRIQDNRYLECEEIDQIDETFANRIVALLNHSQINKHCMVDAYYYDFSVIPRDIKERLNLWRDCYLIFGITTEGEIVSKWADRWDLDSNDPIVDGKVIRSEKYCDNRNVPNIRQRFNPNLLSTPCPDLIINQWKDVKMP
jgi:hypothetical protein